jgi:nicotinate-nucleotide pyrophosphorylase (carboxylating)
MSKNIHRDDMKPEYVHTIVQLALAEDLGEGGDITSNNLIPLKSRSKARLIAKADGVICGINLAREVFKTLNSKIIFHALIKDGKTVRRGDIIAEVSGSTRSLLSGERVAVNFLSFLSGIATQTSLFVKEAKPYKADIMDTRKTTPLLRQLERYAVRTAGGVNHRFNLNDMVMIKDNHRIACKGQDMCTVIDNLKKKIKTKIEVEVDNLDQLKEILHSKADIILLDNMLPKQISRAVRLRNQAKSHLLLEASGGITLKNVKQYAATGVDRISVGAFTHSRQVLDMSMEFTLSS